MAKPGKKVLKEVMFEEGETVFRKGDEGENFFIIFEG